MWRTQVHRLANRGICLLATVCLIQAIQLAFFPRQSRMFALAYRNVGTVSSYIMRSQALQMSSSVDGEGGGIYNPLNPQLYSQKDRKISTTQGVSRNLPDAEPKLFPYGDSNWEIIAQEKSAFFYADKTSAIQKIESYGRYCSLWRPRRSGKTLFCEQLQKYYDIAVDDKEFKKLFGNTHIGQNPTAERKKYHILPLSFSDVGAAGDLMLNFRDYINRSVMMFINKYPDIGKKVTVNSNNHLFSLGSLIDAVQLAKQKLYVIIDEYDAFTNMLLFNVNTTTADLGRAQFESTVSGNEAILRDFGNVLKTGTRNSVERMFITGVTPVALGDGFSSLNMVEDITAEPFVETTFGFTAEEVKRGLSIVYPRDSKQFNDCFLEMKGDFDGYRFNKNQKEAVFNPQMSLFSMKKLQREPSEENILQDPNLSSVEPVASFLRRNYRSTKPYTLLEFARGAFNLEVRTSFRSDELFEVETVDNVLASLAFYHGFLTYADPASASAGKLIAPNTVFKKLYLSSLTTEELPRAYIKTIWDILFIDDQNARVTALESFQKGSTADKVYSSLIDKIVGKVFTIITAGGAS